MITVFCLSTYDLPVTSVKPSQDGLRVLTWRMGLFGLGLKYDYIPVCVVEGANIEETRTVMHKVVDSWCDSASKRKSA